MLSYLVLYSDVMVATMSGHHGQNVLARVVRGYRQDTAHVLIHPVLTVAETVVDWDQIRILNRARRSAWALRMVSLLRWLSLTVFDNN